MNNLLTAFRADQTSVYDFIQYLLHEPSLRQDPIVLDLHIHAHEIISLLQPATKADIAPSSNLGWAYGFIQKEFKDEVQMLILNGEEWQFGAARASVKQILEFRMCDNYLNTTPWPE